MRFSGEADLFWWQAAKALATVPWDGRRRIDRKRLTGLEDGLAKFEFREIREGLPREFRFRGIAFRLEDAVPKENGLLIEYVGRSGDIERGRIVFTLDRTSPGRYRTTVTAEQDRMDHFLRENDVSIFKEIVDSFLHYIRINF